MYKKAIIPANIGWRNDRLDKEITESTGTANTADDLVFGRDKIGSIIKLRLKRIAGTGTEPAVNPFVEMVGIHYQKDTLGSRKLSDK